MSLLIPLGLLGLISIIALILIYVLKPNYQQKYISSTFVWKLSIKYKKKRIPISKLRNILLIICQILILIACTLILTKPVHYFKAQSDQSEAVVIVDCSASMRAENGESTRYERALAKASELSSTMFNRNGLISIIIADAEPHYLQLGESTYSALRLGTQYKDRLLDTLADMTAVSEDYCSYGIADVDRAFALCEEVLEVNPAAEIHFFTDENYSFVPNGINVVDVSDSSEWNAAILNAEATVEENFYTITVDVASYGKNSDLTLNLEVVGANASERNPSGDDKSFSLSVLCDNDQPKTVVFKNENLIDPDNELSREGYVYFAIPEDDRIYSYQSIHAYIEEDDSFKTDNDFFVYGGQKTPLKVQYVSTMPNSFINSALLSIRNSYSNLWDMQIIEPKEEYETSGFDFYIFEHMVPEKLPDDGVVLLFDPTTTITEMALRLGNTQNFRGENVPLVPEETHEIIKNIDASHITVSMFTRITSYDESYKVLMTCDNYPMMLVREEGNKKVVVMPFNLHYSNFAMIYEFPLFMLNMFNYFLPPTVRSNSFEVNEKVELHSRGEDLKVISANGEETIYTQFPNFTSFTRPGVYQLEQLPFGATENLVEQIYVNIPSSESNVKSVANTLRDPRKVLNEFDYYDDLLLWFAAALSILLFIEWLLQARDNM